MPVLPPAASATVLVGQTFLSVLAAKQPYVPVPFAQRACIISCGLPMAGPDPKLRITRRHLPHWTLEGSAYFVTMRLRTRRLNEDEIRQILSHIVSGNGCFYELDAAVVNFALKLLLAANDTVKGFIPPNGPAGLTTDQDNYVGWHRKKG